MKWSRDGRASDLEDRRGGGGGGPLRGGMGGRGVRVGGGMGIVGVLLVIALQMFGGGGGGAGSAMFDIPTGLGRGAQAAQSDPLPAGQDPDKDLRDFSSYVYSDVQDMWEKSFQNAGRQYRRGKLVLYRGGTQTGGCGFGQAAAGPFYCPADDRVYLDLSFYQAMERQLGASGDFAWAYVIAHEVGHHVQNILGASGEVERIGRSDPSKRNALSVRLELQADCYAGVWARSVFDQLEDGDIEEAMRASESVGDDSIAAQSGSRANPDSFTHGSSEQRMRWFKRGADTGEPARCDTFSAGEL